ncbi:hypothetical protein [Sphingobium boeckii]|uniref:hypothetical protein n=1 Tax=Sphingobium boeckii TaxID=1082345 RepID=UPI001607A735|nr:hypothetical protein [Sphingobium boeckii]
MEILRMVVRGIAWKWLCAVPLIGSVASPGMAQDSIAPVPVAVAPPLAPPIAIIPAAPAESPAADTLSSFFRPINPLLVMDADFLRHRDPALWAGLAVAETRFVENGFAWHFFRITNSVKPDGPFWAVPHDDENAAFSVALDGVRTHGGVAMIVSTTADEESAAARYNLALDGSGRIDPNRNFTGASPRFIHNFLSAPDIEKRLVLSVHTNSPGYSSGENNCGPSSDGGKGNISIRVCDPVMQPYPSFARAFPFNDDDTLTIVPIRPFAGLSACGKILRAADYNVVAENIWATDGSLSNYLMLRNPAVRYVTLEAPHETPGNGETRARLKAMAEGVIARCP